MHELAHFMCAYLLGYKPENFVIRGFGIELGGVRGRFTPNAVILVAISGPAVSMLLACIGYYINNYTLFVVNISVAFLNFLPAYPLDGGQVLYGLMIRSINRVAAVRIMRILGRLLSLAMIFCGICILYVTKYNFSMLYVGMFIFFNAGGALYNPVTEIAAASRTAFSRASVFEISGDCSIIKAANRLPCNSIGAVKDSGGKIMGFVTPYGLYNTAAEGENTELKYIFEKNKRI